MKLGRDDFLEKMEELIRYDVKFSLTAQSRLYGHINTLKFLMGGDVDVNRKKKIKDYINDKDNSINFRSKSVMTDLNLEEYES